MNLEDFRSDWVEDLRVAAEANQSDPHSEFVFDAVEQLQEAEEVENVELGYFEGLGPNGKTKMVLDGYAFDSVDKSCVILLSDFSNSDEIQTLTSTDIDRLYNKMSYLVESALSGYIVDSKFEESTTGYSFAVEANRLFNNGEISKFRFYILTDKVLSKTVKNIQKSPIAGKKVDLNAWDINRFFQLYSSSQGKEEIEIDSSTLAAGGIPFVSATNGEDYSAYLAVVPGQFLADTYLQYGSRLLEGNVRSFLSIRGKVNKAIRGTILQEPDMFFAYNNGIAATASAIETSTVNGVAVITKINDMQIINGGQTTASIANSVIQDKANLEGVFIPMKLSVVDHDKAKEMIPIISRSANSQNKVDEADFFSNHPYHVRIEEYSRRVLAPPINGNQYQTAWFYERARGQYVQEQMKLTRSERTRYQLKNPKTQLLRKVDVAKFINSYEQKPHIVSRGAQFNMRSFAESIDRQWKASDQGADFSEYYWKKLIALTILFKTTERIVSAQDWYQEIKAYRANIVTYSVAVIMNQIEKKYKGKTLDFLRIWNTQSIPSELESQLVKTTKEVFDFLTRDDRTTLNVTEWAKKEECWNRAENFDFILLVRFTDTLIGAGDEQLEKEIAHKEQKVSNQISAEIELVNLGADYWRKVYDFGKNDRLLSEMEDGLLNVAATFEITGRIPSDKQAKLIMQIRNRLYDEGLSRH